MGMNSLATPKLERRRSSSTRSKPQASKFPDFYTAEPHGHAAVEEAISRGSSPGPLPNGLPQGLHSSERWPLKRDTHSRNSWRTARLGAGWRSRQKSLSDAIRTVRGRNASISENASEIADSLKAPVSPKLVLFCIFWYGTSILTNASSKAILTAFPKPITLTVVQFYLVCFWCLFLSWLARRNAAIRNLMPVLKNGIRRPSKDIIMATLPLAAFQIGGHILNSDAMSRIPVSLVHTIKGLSPLMTVIAYRVFFNARYSWPTYFSLLPLTLGVIMACSASFQGNIVGLTYAFGSAILFVTQNIVSKTIFNEAAKAEQDGTPIGRRKPDKLNLLCYSSGLAFLFTFPLWLWSEGFSIAADFYQDGSIDLRQRPGSLDHGALVAEYLVNGTFHFSQSLVAFMLLGMVTPVTYSVASLIKRVAVILFAIVWFGNPMTGVQGFGFGLTFVGLYLYDRTSDAAKVDKRAQKAVEAALPLLPMNAVHSSEAGASGFTKSSVRSEHVERSNFAGNREHMNGSLNAAKAGVGSSAGGMPIPLQPGRRTNETWNESDAGEWHVIEKHT